MTDFNVKKIIEMPSVKNAILIEGLPGIGNVSRISVEYLIDKLKAEKILEIYSNTLPNSVIVTEDSLVKMFRVELYYAKAGDRDLLLLSGDSQPAFEKDNYNLSEFIIELVKNYVNEIITLGGIGHQEIVKNPKIHCVLNNLELKKKLQELNVIFDGNKTIKLIIGAAGLLIGIGQLYGINGFSLLVDTLSHPQYIGVKESRELLKVLSNYLKLNISLKELDEEIKELEEEIKNEIEIDSKLRKHQLKIEKQSYIG